MMMMQLSEGRRAKHAPRAGWRALSALAAAIGLAGAAHAQTAVLNTGSTENGTLESFLSGSAYADEFSVAGSSTVDIGSVAAFVQSGSASTGTLTFTLYSGTFVGSHAAKTELDTTNTLVSGLTSTAQWVSASPATPWVVTNTGSSPEDLWIAVSYSNNGVSGNIDLPLVTNSGPGTVPAVAYAYSSTNSSFTLEATGTPAAGIEMLSPIPEPSSLAFMVLGLGVIGLAAGARRSRPPRATAAFG
jgi:hypothetical protein